jgi:hypothetical protein
VASRNRLNITRSDTPEKSHSVYPCEVAGDSASREPREDSSPAEALGSLVTKTWRPGGTLRIVVLTLALAALAVAAPRRPMRKRGPETERSPIGVAVIVLTGAPRYEGTRSACRRSDCACRERWPERRRRRGADGLAASVLVGVGVVAMRAAAEDHVWFEDWWMVASLCDE